jgi:hypothetical protein
VGRSTSFFVTKRLRKGLGKTTLVLWFAAMTLCSAGLLARHLLALPTPEKSELLGKRLGALRTMPHTWFAVHVLSGECRCSLRVASHLVDSTRPTGWSELVLWVGGGEPPADLASQFEVRRVTAQQLAGYGIEAAPLLVAMAPDDQVRYVGGYTDRKQGPVFHDLEVLAAARETGEIEGRPLFGCATSDRLREALAVLPTL